ncbi:MazG family protein [Pumilibacter intestinalis]|jgi:tetrapyrrole methylase family protein/MazG family protein|uniref:MazG family protein n=1 Tax=Pumilibacter intestinalis TaxID=2941511 RepID=UPI002042081D|nr:MazG family protein [Pumilibacter intestinalis]MCI8487109.1 MazG family protein [Clostridia bacterium]
MITVIGIGTEKGDLTQSAAQKIATAKHAFVRSGKTKAGAAVLKEFAHVVPLDEYYESESDFTKLCEKICSVLLNAEREHSSAAYLTDGDGADEIAAALAQKTQTEIIRGVAPSRSRGLGADFLRLSATSALALRPCLDTSVALHVTEIDDAYLAGDLKLWLMEYYGDETEITLYIKNALRKIKLCELDMQRGYDYSCELYVAAQSGFYKQKYTFGDLCRIMDRLVAPDGCPWDKAQTHESIRVNLIEEAYEAVDAIDGGDIDAMTEEIGDVLLQAVFHCNMGRRFGEFELSDVLGTLCGKLVNRHTHIFGENKAANADEALGYWEAAKSEEKSYVSTADKLNRLPQNFPSLLAAEKIYKKLAKVNAGGFDELEKSAETAPNSEEKYAKKLFVLAAKMAEENFDAEVSLNKFLAKIKENFEKAEQKNQISDFFAKL